MTFHNPIIIRRLTLDEIREFEFLFNAAKYNL
jgi:hypothetical protein